MKNKPQRHKETNVFRFKTFADRINDIDLRSTALYHIRHKNEETAEDVAETEFHQTYCKWTVLNLTEEYAVFQKQIRNIVTLPQLLLKKDFVVDTLIDAIQNATVLSLQALLEFVVALARDLRDEFYPYFAKSEKSFLNTLIGLLNTKEPDQTEWTLISLAYLFKILKPYLKKDISIVFDSLIPLLDNRNPEHVTNFAAECFSFVARDIKDKEKFLNVILSKLSVQITDELKQSAILTRGCGQLLFEIVRGVNDQFHSCAETYLRLYFDGLGKVKAKQVELLYDVLHECVTSLLKQISPANMQTFWNACYESLEQFVQAKAAKNSLAINKLLSLMGLALETRDGKYLTNATQFVGTLLKVIDAPEITDSCLQCTSELVAVLLLSKNLILPLLSAGMITKKILSLPSTDIFESFVWNCVNYAQFETLVLPELWRYLDSKHFGLSSLELLAKIILCKAPLSKDGTTLPQRVNFSIPMRSQKFLRKIESIITDAPEDSSFREDPRQLLLALVIYPHVVGVESKEVMNKINGLTNICLDALSPHDLETCIEPENVINRNENQRLIFILSILINGQILLKQQSGKSQSTVKNHASLRKIVEKLLPFSQCDNYRYIHALRLLDLVITFESHQSKVERNPEFNAELFFDIHKVLSNNLSSRYQTVRRTTAHLLDGFADVLKMSDTDQSIYSVFYAVESIEPTIQTYREQLLLFQKIEPSARLLAALPPQAKLDPLKYLLGCLYVNFKLLWKPVMELIEAYFSELDVEEFWCLYKAKIDETTMQQRNNQSEEQMDDSEFIDSETSLGIEYLSLWHNEERAIDLVNYRILLWQTIPSLGMLREIKNREIVTIFLDFIEHEFKKATDRDSLTWTAQRRRKGKKSSRGKDDDALSEDEGSGDENKLDEENVPKGTQRTLITMLRVFVNQNNPKQLHREPELWALYTELLSHRNSAVQKLALDCIVAYKHKYITPYKDHLYNMVDDAKFKEAITGFKVDKESGLLQPEHRPQLMPIVMRILFSKMLVRVGGQKTPNQLRKSLVMRFLGGCHEDEILIMLNMSFWMFENEFKDDACEMCANVMAKTSAANILSPSILQSSLDLIDVIQSEFSGLMSDKFLRYIINVLLVIASTIQSIIHQSKQSETSVSTDMAKPFKHLRSSCLQNLQRFFEHFDSYAWSDNEIEAIFTVFVAPSADKLAQESLLSVTPLLKLFTTFAKTPRLFVLLTRYTNPTEIEDTTPLRYAMDLLTEPKARPLVCLAIMEMIQSLLTYSDDEDAVPLEISKCKPVDENHLRDLPVTLQLNFGSKILLPYLPKLLQKFKMNLKKRSGLTKRDLVILSKITELITDVETSNTLLTVLLPILVRKSHSSAGEEALVQMVNTIINLFKRIERPERHIRSIAPMFEQITAIVPRKMLCQLLQIICDRCSNDGNLKRAYLQKVVNIVSELNALDRRWIEQPDYEKRLGAFKQISEMVAADDIDLNFGLLIVYHSFHFIKYDKDMALRDSASHHLKTIVPALIRKLQRTNTQELDYLIGTVILNLVRRTLRDKNDNVRNEGILLLGEMARECADAHPVLLDLNVLTCKQDREIDFFDNITHLQSLRHGRALLRFCTTAKTLERLPSPRTLTQFILPLASMYIASEKYADKHGIVTSAIETIGAVCHLLPWHQYESILKYYIKNMRFSVQYQKQMVRIVMQILDAFHFDLSKANVKPEEIAIPTEIDQKSDKQANKQSEEKREQTTAAKTSEEDVAGEEEIFAEDKNSDVEEFDEELDALNRENGEQEQDEDDEVPTKKIKICVFSQPIVLSQSIAKKIVHSLATGLIPTLNNSITALSTYESFHKLNKKKRRSEREEEEILRVPIALAVVKLLQKLPPGMLEQNISGILIKVCMFLRSPLISVRMTTRDILKNIMVTVGVEHLETLLSHMTSLLTRGFQVHVLTITVHSLLDALKTSLKGGIMDKCLQYVLDVCLRDIFGQTGEEKEITKIGKHTPEAKPHNKSFLTLSICASNLSQASLLDLLIPFKDQLTKSQSKKIVIRVQECFQKIVAGLTVNKQISIETMLMFIYGIISESIPNLLPGTQKPQLTENEKAKIKRQKPDCFLIPEDPASCGRTGAVKKVVVTNVRANAHVLIELGLELLQLTLKRGKLLQIVYQPFIDPIIPILCDSLTSTHVRVTTFSLKCLSLMISKEITSTKLNESVSVIFDQILNILHKYVAANIDMSAANFNLVQSSFKTIVNILRFAKQTNEETLFMPTDEQLKTLLFYAEQYLNVGETTKQTIAFSLLKVILERKFTTSELNNVLMQVGRLAIQSDSEVSRRESKGIIGNYLIDYLLDRKADKRLIKKFDWFIEFFISNLNYEMEFGRQSAINIIHTIVKRLSAKSKEKKEEKGNSKRKEVLKRKAAVIFVACGSRLINEESAECRQLVADCLETLLSPSCLQTPNERDELFAIVLTLLNDDTKSSHREMAALLCNRFINAEKMGFVVRIEKVLPILISSLTVARTGCSNSAGKFVRIAQSLSNENGGESDEENEIDEEENQRAIDHQLIQLQNTILKIFETFADVITNYPQYANELAYESQKLLAYEHVWVRLNAMKALKIILQSMDNDAIHNALVGNTKTKRPQNGQLDYLYASPEQELKSLTLDLCAQLVPEQIDTEFAEEVTTILLLIANILKNVPFGRTTDQDDVDGDDEEAATTAPAERRKVNLAWLLRRMIYVIHAEVAKAPHSIVLRSAIFNWIEGLTELVPTELISKLAYTLLSPLVREMSEEDQNINAKLRKLAIRVGDAIRSKIGDDEYNLLRAQIQKKLMMRRAERKKLTAMEKVSDPVRAAMRSKGIRDRKKLAKKRTMDAIRGRTQPMKKRKKFNHANDDI